MTISIKSINNFDKIPAQKSTGPTVDKPPFRERLENLTINTTMKPDDPKSNYVLIRSYVSSETQHSVSSSGTSSSSISRSLFQDNYEKLTFHQLEKQKQKWIGLERLYLFHKKIALDEFNASDNVYDVYDEDIRDDAEKNCMQATEQHDYACEQIKRINNIVKNEWDRN